MKMFNSTGDIQSHLRSLPVLDWPIKKGIKDYKKVLESYLIKTCDKQTVRAVLQVGSVGAPGVSDLDLFIVLKDDVTARFKQFGISKLTSDEHYIMMHEPLVINEPILSNLRILYPYFDLIQVFGNPVDEKVLEKPEINSMNALCFLAEYVITKIPRVLVDEFIYNKHIRARLALVLVNSVRHSISMLKLAGGTVDGRWEVFFNSFNRFRQTCPEQSKENEDILKNFIAGAVEISFELVDATDKLLKKLFSCQEQREKQMEGKLRGLFPVSFTYNWSVEKAITPLLKNPKNKQKSYHLPIGFLYYCSFISKHKSHLGRFMFRNLSTKKVVAFKDEVKLFQHLESVEEYILFSRKRLNYRGSVFITLGAGDNFLERSGRFGKSLLKRVRLGFA